MTVHVERFREHLLGFEAEGARVAEWSLSIVEGRRLSLETRDGQTGNAHVPLTLSESCGAHYLVVWSDGRVSRGALERRQLEHDLDGALRAARRAAYDDPDAAQVAGPAPIPEVELHDAAVASVAGGEVAPLQDLLATMRPRVASAVVRSWSGSLHATETRSRLATSSGLDETGRGTLFSWYVGVNGEIGCAHSARVLDPVDRVAARLERLLETAARLDVPEPAFAGGELPVLLHPDVVEELVLGSLVHQLSGATVAHGEGWFPRERFAAPEPVLRDDLTFRIDPLVPLRSGSYRLTSEGIPAARCTFVERGRLLRPIAGLKYARRLGVAPTPVPGGSDTSFLEGPPALSLAEACRAGAGGGLVLSVLGVHTLDAASGDFSLAAPQVLRLGPAGVGGRFRATLSGNLRAMLGGDELRLVAFEDEHTPGLLTRCRLDPK